MFCRRIQCQVEEHSAAGGYRAGLEIILLPEVASARLENILLPEVTSVRSENILLLEATVSG